MPSIRRRSGGDDGPLSHACAGEPHRFADASKRFRVFCLTRTYVRVGSGYRFPRLVLLCLGRRWLVSTLSRTIAVLRRVVHERDARCLPPEDVLPLLSLFAEGERLCAAGKTLVAKRLDETGIWKHEGHQSAGSSNATATRCRNDATASSTSSRPMSSRASHTVTVGLHEPARSDDALRVPSRFLSFRTPGCRTAVAAAPVTAAPRSPADGSPVRPGIVGGSVSPVSP